MNIPNSTVSVIVSSDGDAIRKLMSTHSNAYGPPPPTYGGTAHKINRRDTMSDIVDGSESSFVFLPGADSTLISLSHSHAKGKDPILTLEFLDPGRKFEQTFFKAKAASYLDSIFTNLSEKGEAPPGYEPLDWRLLEKYSPGEDLNIGSKENIYVMYGMGTDIRTWNVVSGKIKSATVDLSKGSRELTLEIVPGLGVPIESGSGQQSAPASRSLFARSPTKQSGGTPPPGSGVTRLRIEGNALTTYFIGEETKDVRNRTIEKGTIGFDIHKIFVHLLKSFIQQFTKHKDAIVFLPECNDFFRHRLEALGDIHLPQGDAAKKKDLELFKTFATTITIEKPAERKAMFELLKKKTPLSLFLKDFGIHLYAEGDTEMIGEKDSFDTNKNEHEKRLYKTYSTLKPVLVSEDIKLNDPASLNLVLKKFEEAFYGFNDVPDFTYMVQDDAKVLTIYKDILGVGDGLTPVAIYGDSKLIQNYLLDPSHRSKKSIPLRGVGTVAAPRPFISGGPQRLDRARMQRGTDVGTGFKKFARGPGEELLTFIHKIKDTKVKEHYKKLLKDYRAKKDDYIVGHSTDRTFRKRFGPVIHEMYGGILGANFINAIQGLGNVDDPARSSLGANIKPPPAAAATGSKAKASPAASTVLPSTTTRGSYIFRYNTGIDGDNVTDLRIALDKAYNNFMLIPAYTQYVAPRIHEALRYSAMTGVTLESKYPGLFSELGDMVKRYVKEDSGDKSLAELKKSIKSPKQLAELYNSAGYTGSADELDEGIDFILNTLIKSSNSPVLFNLKPSAGSPVALHAKILDKIKSAMLLIDVQTTPMFHIAGINVIGKTCFLLMTDLDTYGVAASEDFSPHQGIYLIKGFEHHITSSEVYSKFSIQRSGV